MSLMPFASQPMTQELKQSANHVNPLVGHAAGLLKPAGVKPVRIGWQIVNSHPDALPPDALTMASPRSPAAIIQPTEFN